MWVRASRLDESTGARVGCALWPPEQTLDLAYVIVLALSGALAPMRDSCLWVDDCDVSDGYAGAANASCQSFCARCGQPKMFPRLDSFVFSLLAFLELLRG